MLKAIDVNKIDPSPFQCRKFSDEDKVKELAESIDRDGLIEPIVVRRKDNGRYEIIAGHRRVQAVREYTDWKTIPAQIIRVDDLQARRISAAENLQRENLSVIEEVEAIVEIVDAELIEDSKYQRSDDRDRRSEERGPRSKAGDLRTEVVRRRRKRKNRQIV